MGWIKIKNYIDFINVGFGEATFISIDNKNILIDAGDFLDTIYIKDKRRIKIENYLLKNNIREIDLVIMTHFHKDHIGGVYNILDRVKIKKIILNIYLNENILENNFNNHDNEILSSLTVFKSIINKINLLNIETEEVENFKKIIFDEFSIEIFTPRISKIKNIKNKLLKINLNNLSSEEEQKKLEIIDKSLNRTALAILVKKNKRNIALLTSDVNSEFWNDYDKKVISNTEILQAPHHGDTNYISKDLLKNINPKYFIISADSENTYNLPHRDIENHIKNNSCAKIFYTEAKDSKYNLIRYLIESKKLETIEIKF